MPRGAKYQASRGRRRGRENWARAIQATAETRAREERIEFGDFGGGGAQRTECALHAAGELREETRDFGGFFVGEFDEAIVQLDGLEGLDEQRLARGACGVHHSRHGAAFGGAHGKNEAIVAARDVIFAGRQAALAKDALEWRRACGRAQCARA